MATMVSLRRKTGTSVGRGAGHGHARRGRGRDHGLHHRRLVHHGEAVRRCGDDPRTDAEEVPEA